MATTRVRLLTAPQTFLVSYVARLCLWDPLAPAFTASGPSAQQRPLSPQLPPLLAVSALTVTIRFSPWRLLRVQLLTQHSLHNSKVSSR